MVPSDRALATFYGLLIVNHISICSGLASIFSGKFQATSGRISETVREGQGYCLNKYSGLHRFK